MNNVAFILVGGGNASIPLKDIKLLCGRPLIYWTARAASGASNVDIVFVSTDSPQIKKCVEDLNLPKVQVIGCSPEKATNIASSESALLELASDYDFENVIFIQATSPLLTSDDVDNAFKVFESSGCDSVLSVVQEKRFCWRQDQNGFAKGEISNRSRLQDFESCFRENGALYITNRNALLKSKNRVSGNIKLYIMSKEASFEINEPQDWVIIEHLLSCRLRKRKQVTRVKLFLTDCDGCLTDAGMYYTENGDEIKKFNSRDGKGIELLRNCGIKTGIITSENSYAVKCHAKKLKIDFLELGCKDKLSAAEGICAKEDISLSEVAFVGDDLNDLDLLKAVGLSFAPADAAWNIQNEVLVTTKAAGGQGAIREAAEYILDWI